MSPNQGSPGSPGSQGGTATAQRTAGGQQLSDQQFQQLQSKCRQATGTLRDGYLAVMLHNRAGWDPAQVAEFLGAQQHSIDTWLTAFRTNGIDALSGLPAIAYKNT